jgi:hypothetical protein
MEWLKWYISHTNLWFCGLGFGVWVGGLGFSFEFGFVIWCLGWGLSLDWVKIMGRLYCISCGQGGQNVRNIESSHHRIHRLGLRVKA